MTERLPRWIAIPLIVLLIVGTVSSIVFLLWWVSSLVSSGPTPQSR